MADVITNAPEVQGAPVEPQVAVSPNRTKTVSQIISSIMATGNATRYKNCLVKSCRVEEEDNYTRVSITLGNEVTGFLQMLLVIIFLLKLLPYLAPDLPCQLVLKIMKT